MKRSIEGSIYRAKDKKGWFARLRYTDKDGISREKKRRCLTHELAKNKIDDLKDEIESEKSERKTYRQLDEFFRERYLHVAKFVGGKKISGFRQNLKIVESYLDIALAEFKDIYLDEINYARVEKYKVKLQNTRTIHNNERSVSDVNQNLRRLRRMFNIAVEQEWLMVNPFKRGGSPVTKRFTSNSTA